MQFDRVVCINLARRTDRFDEFMAQFDSWPFGQVDRVNAIDGHRCLPPAWWNSGPGAWGCYRSHLRIIEDALNDQIESLLIFEDDALLCRDFVMKATAFFAELPDDWNWCYLGGQHWRVETKQPIAVRDGVLQGRNVQRTHCYALRGKEIMQRLCKALNSIKVVAGEEDTHHIDKQYGRLMETERLPVYCPPLWLVGQRASKSNIGDRSNEQWWNHWTITRSDEPLVAVLGPFRGGTSCVAGLLHRLGVHMGNRFSPPRPSNPKGFYEASHLKRLCIRSYKEPWLREQNSYQERVTALRVWGNARRDECQPDQIAGGKHPTLCMMVPELVESWGDVRFVVVERPVEESIASLLKRGWGWPAAAVRKVLPMMIAARERGLAAVDDDRIFRLRYHELLTDPVSVVDQLTAWLEIEPTPEQLTEAIDFIDPALRTVQS